MKLSTLGPRNTNSQFAAEHYLKIHDLDGDVVLYATPEEAIDELKAGKADKTILCVVYPALNDIVFQNLGKICMEDVFSFNTDNMVVAMRADREGTRCCSHPAPRHLLPPDMDDVTLVSSNSYAARLVSERTFDVCVTTLAAAREFDLDVIRDFGSIPMGWAVFGRG